MAEGGCEVIRLGKSAGVAGVSRVWLVQIREGRTLTVDRDWPMAHLKDGSLTGVESVRRMDGDWGPLFGRPVYRQVFKRKGLEPRDHAKARANAAISRLRRRTIGLLVGAGLCLVAGLPILVSPLVTQVCLLGAAALAIGAGLTRLKATMAQDQLDRLKEVLMPPVTPPPPLEDWALEAARDEVEAYLASPTEGALEEGA